MSILSTLKTTNTSTSTSSATVLGPFASVSALPAASSAAGALAWCTGLQTSGVSPLLLSDGTSWIMTNNEVAL